MNEFYIEKTDGSFIHGRKKSVKSRNPCPSVIQTTNDIVKAHGGHITIKSKEHEGTTFTIELHV